MTGGNNSLQPGSAHSTSGHANAGTGERGEDQAAAYLLRSGWQIIERNFRCKGGEVDIVAREGNCLVFVEVKTRKSLAYGTPQHAVTPFKQRQISKAALTWLTKHRQEDAPARFDVIAIVLDGAYRLQLEHIRNAFELAF